MSARLCNNDIPFQEAKNRYDQIDCTICLEDFTPRCKVAIAKCKHIFHEQCLSDWKNCNSANHNRCPICSKVIFPQDKRQRSNSFWYRISAFCLVILYSGLLTSEIYYEDQHAYRQIFT